MPKSAVIDTNVVVSALITGDDSPTVWILNSMLKGEFPFLMSKELLAEYAGVLCRPGLVNLHKLTDENIDTLLSEIVVNAMWREPESTQVAPDSGDNHLWHLLASQSESILVTGDKRLLRSPPVAHSVVSPRYFIGLFVS